MISELTEKKLEEGWKIVKFEDLANNYSKRVSPSLTDREIYVGLEHIDPMELRVRKHGSPSEVEGDKLLFNKGNIIFGKRRAYQRKAAVADFSGICSAHAMVLEEREDNIVPGILIHFMHTDEFMDRAISISEGSLSPTIKWKILKEQEFLFPPIDVQKKILSILQKIEHIESKLISLMDSASELINSIRSEIMPLKVDGLKVRALSEFLKESRIEGSTGAEANKITVKLYGLGATAKTGVKGSKNTKYYIRHSGQFIYSKLDFLNGAFAVLPDELDGYESTTDLPSFDVSEELNAKWLFYYVTRPAFYGAFTDSAKGGRKAKRIQPSDFLKTVIPYFDLKVQQSHVETLEEIEKFIQLLSLKRGELMLLREKMFSGE